MNGGYSSSSFFTSAATFFRFSKPVPDLIKVIFRVIYKQWKDGCLRENVFRLASEAPVRGAGIRF